ncbi:MAG: NusG domain II-containing protein [Clostridiales bacterium]|jgi:hypothetical protein|nr:NusG domain II-containing protein [Clostridiales bacterium]
MNRPLIKKHDIFIYAASIIIAVSIYLLTGGNVKGTTGQISIDGRIVKTINLSQDAIFLIDENIRFQVENGAIGFIESNCADKVCVNGGMISRQGQIAVCLPNRVSLTIVTEIEFDTIVY